MNRKMQFVICSALFVASMNIENSQATDPQVSKRPLDHSVYDAWESVAQVLVSNDGRYAVYAVAPQEGDTTLCIADIKTQATVCVERGCDAQITDDSRYVVFKIKPSQAEKKDARLKKKKADEQPRDSLGWIALAPAKTNAKHKRSEPTVEKIDRVKSFRLPEKASTFFACLTIMPDDTAKNVKDSKRDRLIVCNLPSGLRDTLDYVKDYAVGKNGRFLAYVTQPLDKDSVALPGVYLYDPATRVSTALLEGKGEYKLQAFDEEARQLVFYATSDTSKRDPKVYNLYYTQTERPQARIIADTLSPQMPDGWAVNTTYNAAFSRNGGKLYFGISPIVAPKDTTVDESELAQLDVWHYQDDYLQPMQLKQRRNELNRSYLCVFDVNYLDSFVQLGTTDMENVVFSDRGNGEYALGTTTKGYRIESQWNGYSRHDAYVVSTRTGVRTQVAKALDAAPAISTTGAYLTWFDRETAQWYVYSVSDRVTRCLTKELDAVFADNSRQTPEKPYSFGAMGWSRDDRFFYIYDKYDIWQFDPKGKIQPSMITRGVGRRDKIVFRNVHLDKEVDYIDLDKSLLLSAFDDVTKEAGYYTLKLSNLNDKQNAPVAKNEPEKRIIAKRTFGSLTKAKNADVYLYTQAKFDITPDLWATSDLWKRQTQLSHINPQMNEYLWGTAELVQWTSKDNVALKGILYKPEGFDTTKIYPMIVYFYERHSDELYRHFAPAPSRSTVNIAFYCSRGYIVFTPDIHYVDGHPGRSAYNSVVSGVEALCQNSWVDRAHIGIQGQSWGGYQTAYLITQTDMFAAAGAGAPVANMTSAYGGIRWATGVNRQMQYERQQSRIGKTLWEGRDLYIENSPLFFADRVNTPLLIMHNDNDGAVPWYQGIEYFTALRRLGKIVYFLQYNGEEHNLVQRRNMRDLAIRLQQFFDYYLKGEPMPSWMRRGIPATEKGRNWGL